MKLLLDTQLLLWAAAEPERLSDEAREAIENIHVEPLFSSASLWRSRSKACWPARFSRGCARAASRAS